MIKKATLEEIQNEIDAIHEVTNLKQISSNSTNDAARISAATKLLEIAGVIKPDTKRLIRAEGANLQW